MPSDQTRPYDDPAPNFRFRVEKNSVIIAACLECSGLTVKRKVETYAEGGINDYVHSLHGPLEYEHIVLKRGITLSDELWTWFWTGVYDLRITPASISIILYNAEKETVQRWDVEGAYPIKWHGPDLKAAGNEVAFESIELAHSKLKLAQTTK